MEAVGSEVVLITGGSGFLGQHIVRELQLRDPNVAEIRILDLKPYVNLLGHEESKPVVSYVGDVTDSATCKEAFQGTDCVIHAAALVSYGFPADETRIDACNVQGTRHVVQLCVEEGVSRLVFCSSAEVAMRPRLMGGMFPVLVGQGEDRALPPHDPALLPAYVASKLRAERLVLAADKTPLHNGRGFLRTLSLRPPLMYGELDASLGPAALWMARKLGGRLVGVTGSGGRQQLTYVGNVAWAHVLAKDVLQVKTADSVGGLPIFITDDTCVDHVYELAARVLPCQVSSLWLPSLCTYPVAKGMEFLLTWLGCKGTLPVRPTSLVSFMGGVILLSRLRAAIHLKYTPVYTEDEAVRRTKDYFSKKLNL